MKKWQWAVIAIAVLLILYVFFKSSREGFEDFSCPGGGSFRPNIGSCFTLTSDQPTCAPGFNESEGKCIKPYPGGEGPSLVIEKTQCPSGQMFSDNKCYTDTPAKCPGSQILVTLLPEGTPKCIGSQTDLYTPNFPQPRPGGPPPDPTCKTGDPIVFSISDRRAMCLSKTPTTTPVPGSGGQALFTGNTTGGSSDTSPGPNSGGGGEQRRKQVFGPLFTSVGDGGNVNSNRGKDTSKTNVYPELLGGNPEKRAEKSGMPTSAGLGSNEDSKFLPTSRVPGDMEKIPDPWRVSQSFSAANYSFKTEPVPFLTDFSAFQK